ncbi:PPE domain-containing protein [Rhodococcus hoagii]|nr:PPE domain-containing protein [Prescottella equi]
MPRGATVNATTLSAGAGPVPLGAASPAWAALSASLADAGATLKRCDDGTARRLGGGWPPTPRSPGSHVHRVVEQSAALAAETSTKASTQAGSYTTAAMTMPSCRRSLR